MLALLRFALVLGAVALLLVAVLRRHETIRFFKAFLLEPSSPVNVALLRIIVFWGILKSAVFGTHTIWYTGLPKALRDPPFGWGWLSDFPLYEPAAMAWAQKLLLVAAACATLGLFTRASVPTAVLVAVLGEAVTMFFAKVNHGNHARMLCALALAFAPCGDALSLDRLWKWWRGQPAPAPSAAYGLPMRVCWLLLATTYFFPGVWKLWVSGDQWVTGERLAVTLQDRWETLETFKPPFRVDQYPFVLALFGIATLVFEIGFIFLLFNRTTRVVAAFSAVGFHLGIRQIMDIPFPPYLPLILLLDLPQIGELAGRVVRPRAVRTALSAAWQRWSAALTGFASRLRPSRSSRDPPLRSIWPAAVAGIVLVAGQTLTGVFHVSSWPISVFPTFRGRTSSGPRIGSDLRIEYQAQDGTTRDLRKSLKRMGTARLKNLLKTLTPIRNERGRAILDLFAYAAHIEVQPGDHVAIIRATWDLHPVGKKANYEETLEYRYTVTPGHLLTLEFEADGKKKKKESAREGKRKRSRDARDANTDKNPGGSEELDE